jgi:hypothetical protein
MRNVGLWTDEKWIESFRMKPEEKRTLGEHDAEVRLMLKLRLKNEVSAFKLSGTGHTAYSLKMETVW